MSLIALSSLLFQKVHVIKPDRSRQGNSERYFVGVGFLDSTPASERIVAALRNIHARWRDRMIPEWIVPTSELDDAFPSFLSGIRSMNTLLLQQQRDSIAKTMAVFRDALCSQAARSYLRFLRTQSERLASALQQSPPDFDRKRKTFLLAAHNDDIRAISSLRSRRKHALSRDDRAKKFRRSR